MLLSVAARTESRPNCSAIASATCPTATASSFRPASTRKRGYGLAIEEGEAGTVALAVVMFNQLDGKAVGTVSIAGPTVRLKQERLIGLSGELKEAARELSALWPVREFHSTMQPAAIRVTQASSELNVRRFARRGAARSSKARTASP